MSDRTSANSFVCTTSFLQTDNLVLVLQFKMVSTLEKKNTKTNKLTPQKENSMDFSLQTLPSLLLLVQFFKIMQKN